MPRSFPVLQAGCVALALLGAGPRIAVGQIALGPVNMVLGTPESTVLNALRQTYRVDSVPNDSKWIVENRDGPPFKLVGMIGFASGRLTEVSRMWTPSDADSSPADAVHAVINALLTLPHGRSACSIEDRTQSAPDVDTHGVNVRCGERTIYIGIVREQGGKENIQISEVLQGTSSGRPR